MEREGHSHTPDSQACPGLLALLPAQGAPCPATSDRNFCRRELVGVNNHTSAKTRWELLVSILRSREESELSNITRLGGKVWTSHSARRASWCGERPLPVGSTEQPLLVGSTDFAFRTVLWRRSPLLGDSKAGEELQCSGFTTCWRPHGLAYLISFSNISLTSGVNFPPFPSTLRPARPSWPLLLDVMGRYMVEKLEQWAVGQGDMKSTHHESQIWHSLPPMLRTFLLPLSEAPALWSLPIPSHGQACWMAESSSSRLKGRSYHLGKRKHKSSKDN